MQPDVSSTTIFLVRHAAHADVGLRLTGRDRAVPLTPEGERQAAELGRRLACEGLAAIETSPRLRARQTAEAIARATGAPLSVADALDEIDFGAWTGLGFDELVRQPHWREWNGARGSAAAPGGESMGAAADRAMAHVARLTERQSGCRVAVVTHCDIIRALVARILKLHLDDMLRFEIAPASISRIEVGAWGGRVMGLNETLDGAAG